MLSPRISVVIPAYNAERYLGEALESVAWQTLEPAEVIVVDDGSTDCTATVAESFAGVRVIRQANGGPSGARNTGVAATTGDFVAFLDADDLWLPDKLELQAEAQQANPEAGYIVGRLRSFLQPGAEMPPSYRAENLGEVLPSRLPSSWYFAKPVFERVGPFSLELRLAEDIEWVGRAVALGLEPFEVPEVLSLRRIHATNISMVDPTGHRATMSALRSALKHRRGGASPS